MTNPPVVTVVTPAPSTGTPMGGSGSATTDDLPPEAIGPLMELSAKVAKLESEAAELRSQAASTADRASRAELEALAGRLEARMALMEIAEDDTPPVEEIEVPPASVPEDAPANIPVPPKRHPLARLLLG